LLKYKGCCRFQPARRRHWYDAVRRVVATVAHESKQFSSRSAGTNKNQDKGKCFQPRSMSPCSVGVFCCSTTQPSDEHQTRTTTDAKTAASSGAGWSQSVTRACDNVYHQDSQPSLEPARSHVSQMRRLRGET